MCLLAAAAAGIYANALIIDPEGSAISLLEEYVLTTPNPARTPEYGPSEIKVLRALLQVSGITCSPSPCSKLSMLTCFPSPCSHSFSYRSCRSLHQV
jgi:hypothetical protein